MSKFSFVLTASVFAVASAKCPVRILPEEGQVSMQMLVENDNEIKFTDHEAGPYKVWYSDFQRLKNRFASKSMLKLPTIKEATADSLQKWLCVQIWPRFGRTDKRVTAFKNWLDELVFLSHWGAGEKLDCAETAVDFDPRAKTWTYKFEGGRQHFRIRHMKDSLKQLVMVRGPASFTEPEQGFVHIKKSNPKLNSDGRFYGGDSYSPLFLKTTAANKKVESEHARATTGFPSFWKGDAFYGNSFSRMFFKDETSRSGAVARCNKINIFFQTRLQQQFQSLWRHEDAIDAGLSLAALVD